MKIIELLWDSLVLWALTGPVSIILSVNSRPGIRSSKLNKCLRQEPAEGYKTVIAHADDVSAVESWAYGWQLGMWQPWEQPAVACGWISSQLCQMRIGLSQQVLTWTTPPPPPTSLSRASSEKALLLALLPLLIGNKHLSICYFLPPNFKFILVYAEGILVPQHQVDWGCVEQVDGFCPVHPERKTEKIIYL